MCETEKLLEIAGMINSACLQLCITQLSSIYYTIPLGSK